MLNTYCLNFSGIFSPGFKKRKNLKKSKKIQESKKWVAGVIPPLPPPLSLYTPLFYRGASPQHRRQFKLRPEIINFQELQGTQISLKEGIFLGKKSLK